MARPEPSNKPRPRTKGTSGRTAATGAAAGRQAKIKGAGGGQGTGPSMVTVAGVVAILTIIAVVVWVILADQRDKSKASEGGASLPPGVSAMGAPIPRGTPKAGAPTLDIFEDFQCPGCAVFEKNLGTSVSQLAADGSANVRYHLMTFLDSNFPGDHSSRAANAAACAVAAGTFGAFHDLVFANQPATEGQGWTDDQLTGYAEQSGLTGEPLSAWQACYAERTHNQYIVSMQESTSKAGVTSTPTVRLDGKDMSLAGMDAAAFTAAVLAAAK